MRTLIYKRTHCGDPDPDFCVFGNHDCMKKVRGYPFDAVIGIGGIGREPQELGIAGKLTWVGVGAHKIKDHREKGEVCPLPDISKGGSNGSGPKLLPLRGPLVTFDDFWCPEEHGPLLEQEYPALASHMKNVPHYRMHPWPVGVAEADLDLDVKEILERAKAEARSAQLANRNFQNTPSKCRPNSCRR